MTNLAVAHVLKFFSYEHLPAYLRQVSAPFKVLAEEIASASDNPETTVALRKLLEAKDAAVRAVLVPKAEPEADVMDKDEVGDELVPMGPVFQGRLPCSNCGERVTPNSKYLCRRPACPMGLNLSPGMPQ